MCSWVFMAGWLMHGAGAQTHEPTHHPPSVVQIIHPHISHTPDHDREGIAVLAYGVLAGGFLTDRWLDQPAPEPHSSFCNRSLVKYHLIIQEWGGWPQFQTLLRACRRVADRHQGERAEEVTIAMVAIAYVLALPGVAAVILGAFFASAAGLGS